MYSHIYTLWYTCKELQEKLKPIPELDPVLNRLQAEISRLMRMHSAKFK
jgi:hypothetical protein